MQFNCFSFYQCWLKCLNTKTMQCRGTVQHNRMLTDYFFQNIPYSRLQFFYHFLSIFNIVCCLIGNQFFHYERLKQFDGHFFRQTTLVNLEFRSYYDNGTTRIVNTLTKKVLAETSLFTFQHIWKRLKSTVSRTSNRTATATIINQGIYRFL